MTTAQYQQMITYLQQQMAQSNTTEAPSQDASNMSMVLSSYASISVNSPYIWIVDSSAIHIYHSRVFFWKYIALTNHFVTLPNGTRILVLGIRLVTLKAT